MKRYGWLCAVIALATLVGCGSSPPAPGVPRRLAFSGPPRQAQAGHPFEPLVRVATLFAAGGLNRDGHDAVTLTLEANAVGAVLTGRTTAYAVHGLATFTELRVSAPGTGYRLRATAPGHDPVVSEPFDVVP